VVGGDCSDDRGAAGENSSQGGGSAAVLEDYAQLGESGVEGEESGEEGGLGVEDCDGWLVGGGGGRRGRSRGRGRGRGDFAVEIENHVLSFHFCEDGVEELVV